MSQAASVPDCDYCQSDNVKLRRKLSASGVNLFLWHCITCERHAVKGHVWLSHDTIKDWQRSKRLPKDLSIIPILEDYSEPCDICGQPGSELHHFAPQSMADLFGDDHHLWSTAMLCKYHHTQWHEIVTWYLPVRRDSEVANQMKEKYSVISNGRVEAT